MGYKPRIAILENSRHTTGAFRCALQEAVLMRDAADFLFVVPTGSTVRDEIVVAGFPVHELPMKEIRKQAGALVRYGPRLLRNTVRLHGLLNRLGVDLLHVNDYYNLLGAAVKFAGWKGRVITSVRLLPASSPAPLRKLWLFAAYRWSEAVIAPSKAVLNQLPAHPKNKLLYDAAAFDERAPVSRTAESQDELRLLYLANYIPGKGHNYALEAFASAASSHPGLCLTMAGGDMGLEKNKAYKAALVEQATALGIADAVAFLDYQSDTAALMLTHDVFLNFSESESFSMTCAEASFYGLPIIASRCGGPEEIVEDGVTGLLVPNRDVKAMKAALNQIQALGPARIEMGKAGSARVRNLFGPEAFVRNLSALLNGALPVSRSFAP